MRNLKNVKNVKNVNKKILIVSSILACLVSSSIYAEQTPRSFSADPRIKMVNYDPNNVVLINTHYGYQTEIVFDSSETSPQIALGDSGAWQVATVTNHLFIKPIASSNSNMTVLTNLRNYNFQLVSSNSTSPYDQTYKLSFIYPDDLAQTAQSAVSTSENVSPTQYNWKYSFTGDKSIAPIQAFDNGKFTYFKFRNDGSSTIPAIFSVDKNRDETLLNYHVDGDYVVVNRVANQYTLRNGKIVNCVYNDSAIGDWQSIT